jgi:hypothetical protein
MGVKTGLTPPPPLPQLSTSQSVILNRIDTRGTSVLYLLILSMSRFALKGQRHEIFDFRFSTWISFSQAPDYTIRAVSNFFHKFAEIFAAQDAPPVSLTSVANGKKS